MKNYLCKVRFVAGSFLALACLLGAPFSLYAQTNWNFESGTADGFTFRSRYVAPPAADDPTVAGDESLTGARAITGLPVAGLAWSIGNFNQYNGQIRTVPTSGIVDPSDTNVMTYGAAFPAGPNARGQTNYLNTYALNQHGDSLHWQTNDQIAKSPVVVLPANAVLGVWAFGGGGSNTPALDVAGEEYTDGSAGLAMRRSSDDALLASLRILNGGTFTLNALNVYAFAGESVYFEVVDAFQGGFGWLAVDEIIVTQNNITLAPGSFTFEAEDFNFSTGQFIDNPVLTPGAANCYFQQGSGGGLEGVDFHEVNPTVHFGFGGVEWRFDGINAFENLPQTTNTFDQVRPAYVTAGIADYDLANNAVNEWWNYTRTFPATNYHVYARVASAGPFTIRMDSVDNGSSATQTLTQRGQFTGAGSGTTALYQMVPLTDPAGTNLLVVAFDGTPKTLRLTGLTAGFNANFYVLVPTTNAENRIPIVNITSQTNKQVVSVGVQTTIEATATDDGTVTNVQFFAGTSTATLALIGQDNTGPTYSMPYTPSGNEGNLIIRVVATDNAGLTSLQDVTVIISDPSAIKLKTNVGNGADNRIIEETPDANGGANADIEIRRNLNNANHRVVVYRFDVSGYDLSQVNGVTLNLYAGRSFSNWKVMLLGVKPGATNRNNVHTPDTYLESALTYNNMPGMLAPDAASTTNLITYDWDPSQVVVIETNQFTSANNAPLLTIGTNLTQYLHSMVGQTNIVLMIEQANEPPDNLLGRTTSKEATAVNSSSPPLTGVAGDFAPYLRFTLGAAPSPITITSTSLSGDQLTLTWTGGTGPYTVQKKLLLTDAWVDHVTGIAGTSAAVTISLSGGDTGFYQVVGQ